MISHCEAVSGAELQSFQLGKKTMSRSLLHIDKADHRLACC